MNVIISNKADDILSSLNIDVIKKIQGEFSADEIVSMFENFFYEKMILDITAIKDYDDFKNIQSLAMNLDANKLIILLDGSQNTSSNEYISGLISMGIYNFTKNKDGIMYLMSHTNSYKDVASMQNIEKPDMVAVSNTGVKILGVKNITENAGATSFIYMLKKHLSKNYRVVAIEIDKNDFIYYGDRDMVSCKNDNFGSEIAKYNNSESNVDIILVDINNSTQASSCNDIIYLLEPSTIKVNKLVATNKEILRTLQGKKVVLNKCLLSPKDIQEFEMEANIKTFYAIPPLNDRLPSPAIDNFLVRLGFLKQRVEVEDKKPNTNKLFGIFGRKS